MFKINFFLGIRFCVAFLVSGETFRYGKGGSSSCSTWVISSKWCKVVVWCLLWKMR